jgi:hypothetical protein
MTHLVHLRMAFLALLFCLALSSVALADSDRTQVGHTINVGPGEEVGEATCFGCSIRVRGHVNGDVTAFGGSILIEDQGQVKGDATAFGGDVRLDKAAAIAGDVTVFGGRVRRDPAASVGGDVSNFSGAGWMLLIVVLPLAFIGGFVTLIVWLVRRLTRHSVPATA